MKSGYKHLFGPVPSRRLGRSLGVDLVPYKTCSFDCIFCQLGRTTDRTVARREYVPVANVIEELDAWFATQATADYITLSGSGEPTLNSRFGRVIQFARGAANIPVALLTNGSLLADSEVRAQAAQANVVKISLSAWDRPSLERVNRPHPDIEFERMVEGQRLFRKEFKGELWMEVFLVWGVNSTARDVSRIAALVGRMAPDRVQLNTAVRPPCETFARAVPGTRMADLARLFDPPAEVIPEYRRAVSAETRANEVEILRMLERRPCTLDQICRTFGLHRNEAAKHVGKLTRTGKIEEKRTDRAAYYAVVQMEQDPGKEDTTTDKTEE